MVASSSRVQALTEVSDLISVIKEYLANPQMADKLRDEVVSLNALTEDQINQHNEALSVIQQKDRAKSEIDSLLSRQEKEKEDHKRYIKDSMDNFSQNVSQEREKLENEHAVLDKRKLDLDEREKNLAQRDARLKEQAALIKGIVQE